MSVISIILLSLFLLNGVWWLAVDFLLRKRSCGWGARIWPALMAGGMGALLALFNLSRGMETPLFSHVPLPLVTALYLWHLLVLPVWLIVVMPVAGLGSAVAGWLRSRKTRFASGPTGMGWSRRDFLAWTAAAAPPAVLFGCTAVSLPQLGHFRIRRFELPLATLPPALDGLTIAHVSDVHVGSFTHGKTLEAIVKATNRLGADLVLLTGDLINNSLDDLPEALEMVRALRGRYGVFLCEGNHDLIPGPHEFERRTKAAGFPLLVNEALTIDVRGEPVQVLGLRWGRGARTGNSAIDLGDDAISRSLSELLELRDPAAFPVLMAHHPHALDPAARANLPLVLAGHTHGGQLMVNENFGFGPALFRYWTGTYRKEGSTLVVSNGVGNWYPLRTAAPAEILHLTLRAGPPRGTA